MALSQGQVVRSLLRSWEEDGLQEELLVQAVVDVPGAELLYDAHWGGPLDAVQEGHFPEVVPRSQVPYQVPILHDLDVPLHDDEKVGGVGSLLKQPLVGAQADAELAHDVLDLFLGQVSEEWQFFAVLRNELELLLLLGFLAEGARAVEWVELGEGDVLADR